MSVTFTIDSIPTGQWTVDCFAGYADEGIQTVAVANSYEDALQAAKQHQTSCSECGIYGASVLPVVDVDDSYSLNVSNVNAVTLLRQLGLQTEDLADALAGEEFLARVVLAQVTADDSEVKPADYSTPGRARWIDCGTPAGYASEKLAQLERIAMEAVRLGREVTWA